MKLFSYHVSDSNPRRDFFWNTAGSLATAMQSVLLLALVTRVCGTDTAGIFSITFSMAQMMYMVGCFEMSNVLVTDTGNTLGLRETIWFRLGSQVLMCLCAAVFAWLQGFTGEKSLTFAMLILYMLLLSWLELCESHMFRRRHLDLSGRSLAVNITAGTCLFGITLMVTESTYAAIGAMCAMSLIWLAVYGIPFTRAVKPVWRSREAGAAAIARLIRLCLPLLITHLVLSYIINAPKLAIDTHLTLREQSYYGYLIMPAACVNMVSLLVVRPQMIGLADAFRSGQPRALVKIIGRLLLWDSVVAAGVLIGGWFLGIPVLSIFYGVDLSGYESMLCLMLLGGCFYAFATLLDVVTTAIRIQHWNLPLYLLTALLALVGVSPMVSRYRLWGAAWSYVACMLILALGTGLLIFIRLMKGLEMEPDKKEEA